MAYATLLNVVAMVWLRRARWVEHAPRIGVLAWQAISVGAVGSVVLAGFALAIPVDTVSGGLAELLHACAMALRTQYATPGGATVAAAGALVAFGALARVGFCLATTWRTGRRNRLRQLDALALVPAELPPDAAARNALQRTSLRHRHYESALIYDALQTKSTSRTPMKPSRRASITTSRLSPAGNTP